MHENFDMAALRFPHSVGGKYYRILLFFLFVSLDALSQNMKVVAFRELENDLTANRYGTSKTDGNGETAALIKIVTPETGFTFDGGALGIVAVEQKAGEIWLYVPRRAQRLTINHPAFGVLRNYVYTVPIESAKTYEMLLDLGTGRFVTINSQRAEAAVEMDGKYLGTAPVNNYYLLYGPHTLKAVKGKWEGMLDVLISANEEEGKTQKVLTIPMRDHSAEFGQGYVTVENNADIYYAGRLVGAGSWKFDLRQGQYEIETRKADCDPERTTINVRAGKAHQMMEVKAPTPHMGWLNLYTRPRNVTATDNGRPINLAEVQTLPVGTHQISISRKGYVTRQAEYPIRRNETTADTVRLERITYVKPLAFYFGGAYTQRPLAGATGMLGAVFHRHDLQASYTFGLTESDAVYWNGDMNTGTKYKMNSIGAKYGFLFPLLRHLAITPQVGWYYHFLTAQPAVSGNTTYGDGASSHSLAVGAKLVIVPFQHLYLFAAPEYMFAFSQHANFKTIANSTDVSADGFAVHAGLLINF